MLAYCGKTPKQIESVFWCDSYHRWELPCIRWGGMICRWKWIPSQEVRCWTWKMCGSHCHSQLSQWLLSSCVTASWWLLAFSWWWDLMFLTFHFSASALAGSSWWSESSSKSFKHLSSQCKPITFSFDNLITIRWLLSLWYCLFLNALPKVTVCKRDSRESIVWCELYYVVFL